MRGLWRELEWPRRPQPSSQKSMWEPHGLGFDFHPGPGPLQAKSQYVGTSHDASPKHASPRGVLYIFHSLNCSASLLWSTNMSKIPSHIYL